MMEHRSSKALTLYLFILFPGFFFYHIAHSLGYAPYIGWFGMFLVLGISAFVLNSTILILTRTQYISVKSLPVSAPSLLFFSLIISVTAINHLGEKESHITNDGLVWGLINIILMLGFYLLAKRINIQPGVLFTPSIVVVYILYLLFTILFYNESNQTIALPTERAESRGNVASYQSMAMCILYTSIIMCPFIISRKLKTILILASVLLLYFVGSRSEFFLLLSIIPVFAYIQYGGVAFACLALISIPLLITAAMSLDAGGRFANTFTELQPGGARYELLVNGLHGIIENPILGDYLGQVRDYGSPNAYIHNILSVYQQYGLFAFLTYLYLTLAALVVGLRFLRFARHSAHVEILIYTSIISFIGVVASKSLGWPLPAFSWGMSCVVLARMANRNSRGDLRKLPRHRYLITKSHSEEEVVFPPPAVKIVNPAVVQTM